MTDIPDMTLTEFLRLLNEAEDAYTRSDEAEIRRINARLVTVGYTVFVREGKVWIENMRQTGRKP